ncbi:pentatricopeptide repeat-containing protein DOT4, chloroplastic [Dendrobium catenatum]|uniref:Pentatricopeptide repeat-containing protein n=1 Tax=Dendrobium catenatum TaxID=906689 RepID=A0A2I0W6V2_9ASPA|nr:pentatricopeptide repeat-containing protein DOT4, chloroplastic [Dendrobium catenatum]PKU71387.1 Pentatricopeptide repeat-containing protein [Dendrobium catenatum]
MATLPRANSSPAFSGNSSALHSQSIRIRKPISCSPSSAHQLFDENRYRDYSGKAALIRSLSRQGEPLEALDLFRELASDNPQKPAALPLAAVLRCCTSLQALKSGQEVHGFLVRNGGEEASACRTQSALVCFYCKCGLLSIARKVFDLMPMRDVVSWTIMLMGYANGRGHKDELMCLFLEMLWSGIAPNCHTLTVMLGRASLPEGKQLQAYIAKRGWNYDAFTGSSLIDLYAKNGNLDAAQLVFDRIKCKDIVCYNSLILGYGRNGFARNLFIIFDKMCMVGLVPNNSTMVGLLNSCAHLGLLSLSRQFHGQAAARGFGPDEVLQGIIIDMYAKCGDLESARVAFDRMEDVKNIAGWNSMICGYGKHGNAMEAFEVFNSMQNASFPPEHITFTCLLSACSHSGLVDEGWKLFNSMEEVYRVCPSKEHYACMVDLLARAGRVREAYEFISRSNLEFDGSVWGALLAACKVWGDADIGKISARKLFEIEPESSGSYVGLASIFAANERWDDAVLVRRLMDGNGVKKDPGHSLINLRGAVQKFRTGEGDMMNCQDMEELMLMCRRLNSNILSYDYDEILVGFEG